MKASEQLIFLALILVLTLTLANCKSVTPATQSNPKPTQQEQISAPRANLEGNWNFTMTNTEGSITGTLAIHKGGPAGYSGWIKVKELNVEAETEILKAELKGQNFIYNGQVKTNQGNYPFELNGTINANQLVGNGKLTTGKGTTQYKVAANRK